MPVSCSSRILTGPPLMTTHVHDTPVKAEGTHDSFATAPSDKPSIQDETALSFETAIPEESPANPEISGKAARKQGKGKLKAQKKAEKKKLKIRLKEKKSSTKVQAVTFPMVALIDEQVRTSIPEELVATVKEAKSKKHIISSNYPYPKQMKKSEYEEEI